MKTKASWILTSELVGGVCQDGAFDASETYGVRTRTPL
jgi:hypothetical protein